MPSPFPGMDPYIEHPEVWSDFHGGLAYEISAALNGCLQERYVARMAPRVTFEADDDRQSERPDTRTRQQPRTAGRTGEGVAAAAAVPVLSRVPMEVPLELYTVEVLRTGTLVLVTAIEILSPVNKRPGHEAHEDYLVKRRRLLRSAAHLIEIDLLRGGVRPPLGRPVPPAPYYVTLSHVERRPSVDVWPIQLWQQLPQVPVPLLQPDPDVALDLQTVVAAVYERGAYARLIDYGQPPPPPALPDAEAAWLDEHLHAQKAR